MSLILSFYPLSRWKKFQHIRSFGAERCILQLWTTFWLPAWLGLSLLLLLFSQTKIGFLCHNVLPHEHQSWDRWMSWLVLRFGSFWIVQSQSQQKQLWNLIKREPIVIAPHPIYSMFTDAKIDPEVAKTKLGITKQTHVLLFFGMIRPYKGLDIALHALAQIIVQQKNVMLVVAGDFWGSKTAYVELIQRLKLEDYVQLDDRYIPDEEVAIYFSAADILVAPYRHLTGSGVMRVAESFGVTVATWQQRSASNFAVETQNGDELTDGVKMEQLVNSCLEKIEATTQSF